MTEAYQRKPTASRDERGILWNKDKWNVQVYVAGVRHYIGRFTTKRAAIAARDEYLLKIRHRNENNA